MSLHVLKTLLSTAPLLSRLSSQTPLQPQGWLSPYNLHDLSTCGTLQRKLGCCGNLLEEQEM